MSARRGTALIERTRASLAHRPPRATLAASALLVALTLGCAEPERAPASVRVTAAPRRVSAPAPGDLGEACRDVGEVRACFRPAGPARVPRPLPDAPHRGGWRCSGAGAARTCEERALGAGPFVASGALHTQRFARLPDDGQWECADFDGAVLCRKLADSAGTVAGRADPAFSCGNRRGHPSERLCLDLAPDLPDGEGPWRCRFDHTGGDVARLCEPGPPATLGRACDAGCATGADCVSGACLPRAETPNCWLDADCDAGEVCALGACARAR
ncbi:MAG: hypothetical protein OZ928_10685 [Polyangiaceae bacterium]|nr:hypothetical protein [Polyangiaceae bacterium]